MLTVVFEDKASRHERTHNTYHARLYRGLWKVCRKLGI